MDLPASITVENYKFCSLWYFVTIYTKQTKIYTELISQALGCGEQWFKILNFKVFVMQDQRRIETPRAKIYQKKVTI
jgi:hypothetical protein